MSNVKTEGENKMGTYEIEMKGDYLLGDQKIEVIKLEFNFYPVLKGGKEDISWASMTHRGTSKMKKGYLSPVPPDEPISKEIKISVDVVIPKNYEGLILGDVLPMIEKDSDGFESSLAHEIKHALDARKMLKNFSSIAKYKIKDLVSFGIPAINEFIFDLYYIDRSESLVRAAEMGSEIKKKGIRKEDFLKFFNENKTIQSLKKIRSWSYEKMKQDLLSQVEIIKERLQQNGISYPEKDEEIVEQILDLLHDNIVKKSGRELDSLYSEFDRREKMGKGDFLSIFSSFLSSGPDPWDSELDKFLKKMRSKDYKLFYKDIEKLFQRESDRLIRKLSKLYDIAESESTEEGSSIKDMDLYRQIKGIKPRILNFKDFNFSK